MPFEPDIGGTKFRGMIQGGAALAPPTMLASRRARLQRAAGIVPNGKETPMDDALRSKRREEEEEEDEEDEDEEDEDEDDDEEVWDVHE